LAGLRTCHRRQASGFTHTYLSIYISIYPSTYPSVCLSNDLSIYPPIHSSIHPSINLLKRIRAPPSASAAVEGIAASIDTFAPAVAFAGLRTCVCVQRRQASDFTGRGSARAEDARGTATQSHISPIFLSIRRQDYASGFRLHTGCLFRVPPGSRFQVPPASRCPGPTRQVHNLWVSGCRVSGGAPRRRGRTLCERRFSKDPSKTVSKRPTSIQDRGSSENLVSGYRVWVAHPEGEDVLGVGGKASARHAHQQRPAALVPRSGACRALRV
jgi:hypothetical protein